MTERWEQDVDRAVRDLVGGPPMNDLARARGRARLQAVIKSEQKGDAMTDTMVRPVEPQRRRKPGGGARWFGAAAAVLALSAGGVAVLQSTGSEAPMSGGGPDAPPQAIAQFDTAAEGMRLAAKQLTAAPEPKPGQYRHVRTHAWHMSSAASEDEVLYSHLAETRVETWIPENPRDVWREVRTITGKRKWIISSEAEVRKEGWYLDKPGTKRLEGPCGKIFPGQGGGHCGAGDWQTPSETWIAGLPTKPDAMLDRLRKDVAQRGADQGQAGKDQHALRYVDDALRSGLLPDDLRRTLFETVALLPTLEITERQDNLDGRAGTSFGVTTDSDRFEIVVDVTTGEYIGERNVFVRDQADGPAGTVSGYTAVQTSVVDGIGERP